MNVGDTEPARFPLPAYTAVIACTPEAQYTVLQDATPATSGCAAQAAIGVPASRNATEPVGESVTGHTGDTVAVKTPALPDDQALVGEVNLTADAPATMLCVNAGDVEPVKLASPL